MKRLYIAIALVIIAISIGIAQTTTIRYSSDKCIKQLKNIETEIENNNLDRAERLCKNAIEEYDFFTEKILYCYYPHSCLEEISQNLAVMAETIKIKDINRYKTLNIKTKKQLQALKDEELFSIQNIL